MFIKLKTGSRAGEIIEMKYMDAKPLLEDGRAEPAFATDAAPVVAPLPGATTPATKESNRKTKRK